MWVVDFIKQLQARRVIRAVVIYAACVWAVLQAADLFAGEDIIPEQWVRWLILLAAAGFPLVLISSWFLESPWKNRGRMATAGDLFLILALSAGAGMFAWQQWFSATTQTTIAVGEIEATDMQAETESLGDYLEERLDYLLRATPAGELRLEGTLSRGGDTLRLTARVVGADGELRWSQTFEQALLDQAELQSDLIRSMVEAVPALLPREARALEQIEACAYPSDADAIMAIAAEQDPEMLADYINDNADNGLLFLQQSLAWYAASEVAPGPRRPVLHALAVQSLDHAKAACPNYELLDELRLGYTQPRAD